MNVVLAVRWWSDGSLMSVTPLVFCERQAKEAQKLHELTLLLPSCLRVQSNLIMPRLSSRVASSTGLGHCIHVVTQAWPRSKIPNCLYCYRAGALLFGWRAMTTHQMQWNWWQNNNSISPFAQADSKHGKWLQNIQSKCLLHCTKVCATSHKQHSVAGLALPPENITLVCSSMWCILITHSNFQDTWAKAQQALDMTNSLTYPAHTIWVNTMRQQQIHCVLLVCVHSMM